MNAPSPLMTRWRGTRRRACRVSETASFCEPGGQVGRPVPRPPPVDARDRTSSGGLGIARPTCRRFSATASSARDGGHDGACPSSAGWPHGTLLALLALCGLFARRQQRPGTLGGPISTPKTLWLWHALSVFFVVPGFLWRNGRLDGDTRRTFGAVFVVFVLRAVVEVPLCAVKRWRCIHGIAHNAFSLGLLTGLGAFWSTASSGADRRARGFAPLLAATLAAESLLAWRFWRVAEPADGVFFAAPGDPRFARINRLTWRLLAVLGPWFAAWLWRSRGDFATLRRP